MSGHEYEYTIPPDQLRVLKPAQVPSYSRCMLIGDPIRADALVYRVHVPVKVTGYEYRSPDPNVIAAPATLNVHPFHGGTEGVGLAFSGLMQRYLAAVMRDLGVRSRRELSEWWESDYGVNRVSAGLRLMFSPQRAKQVLDMVMVCAREEADPVEVAIQNHQTIDWFARIIARCQFLADRSATRPIRYHRR